MGTTTIIWWSEDNSQLRNLATFGRKDLMKKCRRRQCCIRLTSYSIVTKAIRRYSNCFGASTPTFSRTTVLPLAQDAAREVLLGKLSEWGSEILLLPGGQHLLIKRPSGFLQVTDVLTGDSLLASPHSVTDLHQERRIRVLCFDYDVRVNGDIFFLVLSEFIDENISSRLVSLLYMTITFNLPLIRILEILSFSPSDLSLCTVHRQAPPQLDNHHGKPIFAALHGDVIAIYIEGRLIYMNWLDAQLLTVDNVSIVSMCPPWHSFDLHPIDYSRSHFDS